MFYSVHRGKKDFWRQILHSTYQNIFMSSLLFWPFNWKASNAKCRLKQLRMWRAACSSGLPAVMSLYLWQVSEVLEANLCASIRALPRQVCHGSPVLKVPAMLYFLFVYCISEIECAKNITWIHPSKSSLCVKNGHHYSQLAHRHIDVLLRNIMSIQSNRATCLVIFLATWIKINQVSSGNQKHIKK